MDCEELTMQTMTAAAARAAPATHTVVASPLGDLTVVARAGVITGLYVPSHWYRPDPRSFGARADVGFGEVRRELSEYVAGRRRGFTIPPAAGGDGLQRRVRDLVRRVPHGQTSTCGRLARELGDGTTAQEVGAALGRNPLCTLIPRHRIVGSTGTPTGYAGGLRRQQLLLDLERDTVGRPRRLR